MSNNARTLPIRDGLTLTIVVVMSAAVAIGASNETRAAWGSSSSATSGRPCGSSRIASGKCATTSRYIASSAASSSTSIP